jgi:hypothetical protein
MACHFRQERVGVGNRARRGVGVLGSQLPAGPHNNRFERSRGRNFGEPRRESMIEINQLRWSSAQPRVAQPHR